MDFEALFKPRVRPTLHRRITYLIQKFKDQDQVYIDPGELVVELGHAMSPHGVAMRQFLEPVATPGTRYTYRLNKEALKHLVRTIREKDEQSSSVATALRQELVQTTLELAVARERLDAIDDSFGVFTENDKVYAAAEVLFLEQAVRSLCKCSEMNNKLGAVASLEYRERLKDQFLSSKDKVLGYNETLSVS